MNSLFQRYTAAAVGFGFMAVWSTAGALSALTCLLSSAVFYGTVVIIQRKRLAGFTSRFMERRGEALARRDRRPVRRRHQSTPTGRARGTDEKSGDLAYEYGW